MLKCSCQRSKMSSFSVRQLPAASSIGLRPGEGLWDTSFTALKKFFELCLSACPSISWARSSHHWFYRRPSSLWQLFLAVLFFCRLVGVSSRKTYWNATCFCFSALVMEMLFSSNQSRCCCLRKPTVFLVAS